MLERLKQKKLGKKGFTLAELLVVVAIIGVLVAIAIPTFTASKNKADAAVERANARACYAEAMTNYLSTDDKSFSVTYDDGRIYTCTITEVTDAEGNVTGAKGVVVPSVPEGSSVKIHESAGYTWTGGTNKT